MAPSAKWRKVISFFIVQFWKKRMLVCGPRVPSLSWERSTKKSKKCTSKAVDRGTALNYFFPAWLQVQDTILSLSLRSSTLDKSLNSPLWSTFVIKLSLCLSLKLHGKFSSKVISESKFDRSPTSRVSSVHSLIGKNSEMRSMVAGRPIGF